MCCHLVGAATLLVLFGTLVISSLDAHSAASTARLAESLHVANEKLRSVALYDSLTNLPNRVLLQDRLEQAQYRASRSGKMFALMFVDLDRFKPVNDSFGHRVGDLLLKQVAARLLSGLRKEDTAARTGGDEFVILLHELVAKMKRR
jgi:GGDEF domain-containing protein